MEAIAVLLTAFILDLLWGDPRWLPHPVVGIGWCISRLERGLMRLIRRFSLNPATDAGKIRLLGLLFPLVIAGGTFGVTWLAVKVCREWNELAGAVLEAILIWLTIAPRGLAEAGDKIYRALVAGDLKQARHELSMVVGRETAHLDSAEIVRGGVETVAENIVDAIISPLFYAAIGGAPLAFAYRAVNTLDAMVGYRNEKYLYLGWASAKLRD
jgi:adenosylcobinamide-phosphate synthase